MHCLSFFVVRLLVTLFGIFKLFTPEKSKKLLDPLISLSAYIDDVRLLNNYVWWFCRSYMSHYWNVQITLVVRFQFDNDVKYQTMLSTLLCIIPINGTDFDSPNNQLFFFIKIVHISLINCFIVVFCYQRQFGFPCSSFYICDRIYIN